MEVPLLYAWRVTERAVPFRKRPAWAYTRASLTKE